MKRRRSIEVEFDIGEIVYLKVASEPERGMVTTIAVSGDDMVCYGVTWGDGNEHRHYGFELSDKFERPPWTEEDGEELA